MSSFCSVMTHWVFAVKYLTTSLVLPKVFFYLKINLLEDAYQDDLGTSVLERRTMTPCDQVKVLQGYMELE